MITSEQEFKALIAADQALKLQQHYPFAAAFAQTNRYFDTPDGKLRQAGCGLRIRHLPDHSEQTLKVPSGPDRQLLEYTDHLTGDALAAGGQVAAKLRQLGIAWSTLRPFAEATTTRRLSSQPAGLLTLDHTRYPDGFSDWEVELEYHDAQAAQAFWTALAERHHLASTPPINKIQRAKQHHKA